MPEIDSFLTEVLQKRGSDLHFIAGDPARIRLYGDLTTLRPEKLAAEFVKETNGRFAETDKRLAEFVSETSRRFSVLERNGSTVRPKARAKKTKKAGKKGSVK